MMKRFFCLVVLLCLLFPAISTADDPVQASEIALSEMTTEELRELRERIDAELALREGDGAGGDDAVYVWIPKSGKRYHAVESCYGMKEPTRVTLEEAVRRHFTPCSRCEPPALENK